MENAFPFEKSELIFIELLKRKRIDAFMHYEESTIPLLEKLGLSEQIVKSTYQPNFEIRHYIAISKGSVLNIRLAELKQVVQNAVKNKDFLTWLENKLNENSELVKQVVFSVTSYSAYLHRKSFEKFVSDVHSMGAKILIKR